MSPAYKITTASSVARERVKHELRVKKIPYTEQGTDLLLDRRPPFADEAIRALGGRLVQLSGSREERRNGNTKPPPIRCNVCGHEEAGENSIADMDRHFDLHRAPLHRVPEEGAKIVTNVPNTTLPSTASVSSDGGKPVAHIHHAEHRTVSPRGRNLEIVTNVLQSNSGPMKLARIQELARTMNDHFGLADVHRVVNQLVVAGKVRKVKLGTYEWIRKGVERPASSVQQPPSTTPAPLMRVPERHEKPLFSVPNCPECKQPMVVVQPGMKYVPSATVLSIGVTYVCVNNACPSYKPETAYPVQDLISRAQREAEALAKTLGELNAVIGPFLGSLEAMLKK